MTAMSCFVSCKRLQIITFASLIRNDVVRGRTYMTLKAVNFKEILLGKPNYIKFSVYFCVNTTLLMFKISNKIDSLYNHKLTRSTIFNN